MLRILLLALLVLPTLRAASIDVDFTGIAGTQLAETLEEILEVPATEGQPLDQPLVCCTRILVSWQGTNSPPVVRFRGVPSAERMERLAASGAPVVETPWGTGYRLPNLLGYVAVGIGRDEVLAGAPEILATLAEPPAWPETFEHIMSFKGLSSDLKLGELADELVDIDFTWPRDNKLTLVSHAKSRGDAKAVLRYISIRRPLVHAAAGMGIDKADFPSRLLGATTWDRSGSTIKASFDLDDTTRIEAVDYLTKSLRRHLRKYRKIKAPVVSDEP